MPEKNKPFVESFNGAFIINALMALPDDMKKQKQKQRKERNYRKYEETLRPYALC